MQFVNASSLFLSHAHKQGGLPRCLLFGYAWPYPFVLFWEEGNRTFGYLFLHALFLFW